MHPMFAEPRVAPQLDRTDSGLPGSGDTSSLRHRPLVRCPGANVPISRIRPASPNACAPRLTARHPVPAHDDTCCAGPDRHGKRSMWQNPASVADTPLARPREQTPFCSVTLFSGQESLAARSESRFPHPESPSSGSESH